MIIIEKQISEIKQPYFFYTGKFKDIDQNYFIDKINDGCKADSNNSFKSNIVGEMTNFKYFNNDIQFLKLMWQIFDIVDKDVKNEYYKLSDAWGLKNGLSHYTKNHNHIGCYFSGVIYLNKHSQTLYFPEINKKIEPDIGSFGVFTSFLNHYCNRNLTEDVKYALSFNCNYGN